MHFGCQRVVTLSKQVAVFETLLTNGSIRFFQVHAHAHPAVLVLLTLLYAFKFRATPETRLSFFFKERLEFCCISTVFTHRLLPYQHAHFIPTVGVGKERRFNWSIVTCKMAAPVTRTTLKTTGPVPADSRQWTPSVRNCVTR